MSTTPRATEADIALLLEGTYPFVSGGVSSWTHQIIQAHPELRFALVFLGSRRTDYTEMRYTLPPNVVHLETHFLHDDTCTRAAPPRPRPGNAAAFADIDALHHAFRHGTTVAPATVHAACAHLKPGGALPEADFHHAEAAWQRITEHYRQHCADPSFVDYFWSVRIMHRPLWQLARIADQLIPARAYHSISTGYAGFLGALLTHATGRPLILTEHGIYTKERKIDLFQSEWISDNRNAFQRDPTELSYFRQLWIRFFEWMGRLSYDAAGPIISLYEANRARQIADGAPAARTQVIPNGVALDRLAPLRTQRRTDGPPVLCLIGRVVPIKDVKNFIRAMRSVRTRLPEAVGWIAGPLDEDPTYVAECRNLIDSLGLGEAVRLLGMQRIDALLPKVRLVVLSSISEALPLVVLEAFAAGVPCVSTDVGACRELIEGQDAADRALGHAGAVVGIANPQALADAALDLLASPARWQAASEAGVRRVEARYSDALMFQRYRAVYDAALSPTLAKEPQA
ncbi:GT4 family glycosyltransferase PelF [Denitromonas sp.]|uniref:GT4 family glycosyltransferase PelF n=1 Tax=Denitromonas sp. TaxID=2734609 RepID=UPI002AFDDF92|nr:GT4 family glycosyltransferase PelF [Denitromonas sp.]